MRPLQKVYMSPKFGPRRLASHLRRLPDQRAHFRFDPAGTRPEKLGEAPISVAFSPLEVTTPHTTAELVNPGFGNGPGCVARAYADGGFCLRNLTVEEAAEHLRKMPNHRMFLHDYGVRCGDFPDGYTLEFEAADGFVRVGICDMVEIDCWECERYFDPGKVVEYPDPEGGPVYHFCRPCYKKIFHEESDRC